MAIEFLEAVTQAQLDKVFAFRYGIVCERLGVTELDYCEVGRETDRYDEYALQIAAFDERGEVVACVRLIHHSPIGYPTATHMHINIDTPVFASEKLAEISRIFVDKKYRGLKSTKHILNGLIKIIYVKMVELGIEYSYGALEKPFLKLLNMFDFPYKPIGEEQEYVGRRYPCIMYTQELAAAKPELQQLWSA